MKYNSAYLFQLSNLCLSSNKYQNYFSHLTMNNIQKWLSLLFANHYFSCSADDICHTKLWYITCKMRKRRFQMEIETCFDQNIHKKKKYIIRGKPSSGGLCSELNWKKASDCFFFFLLQGYSHKHFIVQNVH